MNATLIDTALCRLCGTTVMKSFFHEHMTYVHGSQSTTVKKSKPSKNNKPDKQIPNPKNKVDDKKKKQDSNRKISNPKGIVKVKRFENTPVKCILCGQSIEAGKMLVHKQNVHGEKPYSSSTVGRSPSSQWVQIYQGGLPGLGKRHR